MDLAESRKKSPMDIPDRRALAASKHRGLSHLPVSTAREGERDGGSAISPASDGGSLIHFSTTSTYHYRLPYSRAYRAMFARKGAVTNDKHGRSQSGSIVAIEWVAA